MTLQVITADIKRPISLPPSCCTTSTHCPNIVPPKINMPGINYHQGQQEARRSSRGNRPDPILRNEICTDCIVWLPWKEGAGPEKILCIREGNCEGDVPEEDEYCHPVVVLEVHQRPGSNVEGDLTGVGCKIAFCGPLLLKAMPRSSLGDFFDHTSLENYIKHQNLIKFWIAVPVHHGESFDFGHMPQIFFVSG